MVYFKIRDNGYIVAVGKSENIVSGEISEEEYLRLLSIIESKPAAPDGYRYRLRDDSKEWELCEYSLESSLPADEDDYLNALERFGVV